MKQLKAPTVDRLKVVAEAAKYVNTPFVHQGRDRNGMDCLGLIIRVAHDLGLSEFDYREYGRVPPGTLMKQLCDEQMRPGEDQELPGTVLLFAFTTTPQHLALRTQTGVIHAYERVGKVIHSRYASSWRNKVVAFYDLPGVIR